MLDSHGGIVGAQFNVGGLDTNLGSPVTYNYTATVEKKLFHEIVASAGYSGSQSRNLIDGSGQQTATSYGIDINRFAGDLILNYPTPKRLNPSFGSIRSAQNGAVSGYNALILALRGVSASAGTSMRPTRVPAPRTTRKYTQRLQICINTTAHRFGTRPNRFSLSLSYDIPGMSSGNAFARSITNGWVFSDITIFQSGYPFTVYTGASFQPILNAAGQVTGLQPGSGDYNADGFNYDFPNVASYSQGTSRRPFLMAYFRPAISLTPSIGTEGNEVPYQYRGPNYFNSDISLAKNTKIYERLNLQFRFDFFNIFNRPNLTAHSSGRQAWMGILLTLHSARPPRSSIRDGFSSDSLCASDA